MPSKPPRSCLHPGCPELTTKTYCKQHEPKKPKYDKSKANPFYGTARWQKFRNRYRKQHPLCEMCLKSGLTVKAELVDHIIPIKKGGAKLDPNNTQSLCRICHARKTADDMR